MSSGLLALLDDVAAIAKTAAAHIDDVAVQTAKASSKAAGVVIDDAAVTPKYVVGLSPARELPIIWNIAKGSIKNKLLILLPIVLLLGTFLPWIIAPLLAIGGAFLCFEGYEKLHHILHPLHEEASTETMIEMTVQELERERTAGAIRTDFILSAEIMAISYGVIAEELFWTKAATLVFVAVMITAVVYGAVGIIVKADDVGLHFAKDTYHKGVRAFGRGLVLGMPIVLKILTYVGTAAMLWVGGGIILHTIPAVHHAITDMITRIGLTGFAAWAAEAGISFISGVIFGYIVMHGVTLVQKIRKRGYSSFNF